MVPSTNNVFVLKEKDIPGASRSKFFEGTVPDHKRWHGNVRRRRLSLHCSDYLGCVVQSFNGRNQYTVGVMIETFSVGHFCPVSISLVFYLS